MDRLIVLGSIAFDTVTTPAGAVSDAIGGTAFYFSVAASFFNNVGIISVVGNDFPKNHIEFLNSRDIDTEGLEITDGKTFRWRALYEGDMNEAKTLGVELNVISDFEPRVPDSYRDAEYLFLGNIDPEQQLGVINQMKKPKFIALDTMNFWIENKKEKLLENIKRVNLLFLNDSEARLLFETNSLLKAAKSAMEFGPEYVIIKKGEHGAVLFSKDGHFSVPAYMLENLVDPTGAGDSFAGGFMGWISKTDDISEANMRRAMIYASTIASFNAEGFSLDKLKNINITDIQNRYNEFKNMVHFE